MIGALAPAMFLSLIGFALGATACIFFLAHQAHRRAWNAPLFAALALLSLRQLAFAAAHAGWIAHALAVGVGTMCLFLFWPALVLYVQRSMSVSIGLRRWVIVAVPALISLALALLSLPGRWFPPTSGGAPGNPPHDAAFPVILVVLLMMVYAIVAIRSCWRRPAADGPLPTHLKLRWLRLLSLGAAVIPAMMAVTVLLDSTTPGLRGVTGILNVAAEVAFLELVIPAAMLNSRVLSEPPDPEELIARSVPALAQIGLIKKHVVEYMTTKRPYRNPDLRLSTVAGAVGVPPHVLSSVINREFGLNFTDFVNRYRIREAQELLLDPESQHYTIQAVAFEVGFATKAPFNRAFKRLTGLTPTEFQREHLKDPPESD